MQPNASKCSSKKEAASTIGAPLFCLTCNCTEIILFGDVSVFVCINWIKKDCTLQHKKLNRIVLLLINSQNVCRKLQIKSEFLKKIKSQGNFNKLQKSTKAILTFFLIWRKSLSQIRFMKINAFSSKTELISGLVSMSVTSKRVVKLEDRPAVCFHFRQTGGVFDVEERPPTS